MPTSVWTKGKCDGRYSRGYSTCHLSVAFHPFFIILKKKKKKWITEREDDEQWSYASYIKEQKYRRRTVKIANNKKFTELFLPSRLWLRERMKKKNNVIFFPQTTLYDSRRIIFFFSSNLSILLLHFTLGLPVAVCNCSFEQCNCEEKKKKFLSVSTKYCRLHRSVRRVTRILFFYK